MDRLLAGDSTIAIGITIGRSQNFALSFSLQLLPA